MYFSISVLLLHTLVAYAAYLSAERHTHYAVVGAVVL